MDENSYRPLTNDYMSRQVGVRGKGCRDELHSDIKPGGSRLRRLTLDVAIKIAVVSAGTIGILSMILFGLWFQPGWANGWPFSKHTVWASVMTVILAVGVILISAALLIFPCYIAEKQIKRAFVGWSLFLSAMFLVSATILIFCPLLFQFLRTEIEAVWH